MTQPESCACCKYCSGLLARWSEAARPQCHYEVGEFLQFGKGYIQVRICGRVSGVSSSVQIRNTEAHCTLLGSACGLESGLGSTA